MILSTYNLLNYVLLRKWENTFSDSFIPQYITSGEIQMQDIAPNNPRNIILKLEINKVAYVFKQPKSLTSGATWFIFKENQFYDKFKTYLDFFLPSKFDFDENNSILILPCMSHLEIPIFQGKISSESDKIIQLFAEETGEFIGGFHKKLKIDRQLKNEAYKFIRDNISPFYSSYRMFFNSLRQGYKRPEFLDTMVYRNLVSANLLPILRDRLYNFIWSDEINKELNNFAISWSDTDKYLIHGDLKLDNIFRENKKLKLLDFELVSKGDNAWEIIYFIDSVLKDHSFSHGDNLIRQRHLFFHYCFKSYCNKIGLKGNKKIEFTKRILKFWVIKKLMNFMNDMDPTKFEIQIEVISEILLKTDSCVEAIMEPDKNEALIKLLFSYK